MNRVVRVFRYKYTVKVVWLCFIRGFNRIRRKIFVTIMVLECSRVEIGVGFFMVEGSYG